MNVRLFFVVVSLCVCAKATAQDVLWDTGAPHQVNFNATETYLGFSSGDLGAGSEQRWAAMPFRIDGEGTVITRIDVDWFIVVGSEADNVNYIIWNRTDLNAPVDGDQFSSGTLGAFGVGIDDPRVDGVEDWLHQYDVNIPIPAGDYYLTIYADGGTAPNNAAWLTGGDLQDEALEQDFMWRSAQFPSPGFVAYNPGTILPGLGMLDPDDRWNCCFTLYGTTAAGPNCPTGFTLGPDCFQQSGDFTDSCESDDVYWGIQSTTFAARFAPAPINIELDGVIPIDGNGTLTFCFEGHPTLGGGTAFLTVALFNYTTGLYEQTPFTNQPDGSPGNDTTYCKTVDNSNGDYVDGEGNVKARITCAKTGAGPVRLFIDSMYWE